MEPSTQTDNPATTQGVSTGGDVNQDVLSNLVKTAQEKFGPAPSAGEPDSTQPTPPADKTGQPEGDVTPPDDTGKLTRLEQQLKKQSNLLVQFGIDPDSDVADKLAAGIITKDDILGKTEPEKPPANKVAALKSEIQAKLNAGKGLEENDFLRLVDLLEESNQQTNQFQEQSRVEALIGQCEDAMLNHLNADQFHVKAPENIQQIEQQLFLSSTDNLLTRDAQSFGDVSSFIKPKTYGHYAAKNLERLQTYRTYLIELGKQIQMQSITGKPGPNPVSSTTGAGPTAPPSPKINATNISEATRNYFKQRAAV